MPESPVADILSLSKARKTKVRADKEQQAAENRAKFGRTKSEKQRDKAELARAAKASDDHKRET
jgi:hypothetical protein